MKKIIFMLAAAAVVASCSKTEIYENGQATGPDIIAKPVHQLVNGELSRAPFIGNIAADNHLTARVLTYKADNAVLCDGNINFTTPTTVASYVSGQTFITGDGKYTTPLDASYTMTGLYPASGWTGTTAPLASAALKFTFAGKEDLMTADKQTISDTEIQGKDAPTLTFKHQLTKFEVKVKAKDAGGKAAWSYLKSVSIAKILDNVSNLKNEATCDLNTGAVTFAGTGAVFNFYGVGADGKYGDAVYAASAKNIYETTDAEYKDLPVAYTMVAPFVPTNSGDVELTLMANDGTTDKPFTINVSIPTLSGATTTAGYAYTIMLTFADDATIIAKAEVTDWENGGVIDHTINK